MNDSGDLKPGTLCYVLSGDPFMHGRVVEVIGPYTTTPEQDRGQWFEVWADWLNNGTWGRAPTRTAWAHVATDQSARRGRLTEYTRRGRVDMRGSTDVMPRLRAGTLCELINLREQDANGLLVEVVSSNAESVTCRSRRWPEALLFIPPQCLRPVQGELT